MTNNVPGSPEFTALVVYWSGSRLSFPALLAMLFSLRSCLQILLVSELVVCFFFLNKKLNLKIKFKFN